LHGKRLDAVLRIADRMLIPLQPSLFDIQATHAFLREVREHRRAPTSAGPGGMRIKRAHAANEQLHQYLSTLPVPVVAWLRDTQNYVQLAAHGLTLWDVAPSRVERDLEQWQALKEWLRAMKHYPRLQDLAAARRQRDRRQRLDHHRPGAHRPLRRGHRRPPVDPRRPGARRAGALRRHGGTWLPHAEPAARAVRRTRWPSTTCAWASTTAEPGALPRPGAERAAAAARALQAAGLRAAAGRRAAHTEATMEVRRLDSPSRPAWPNRCRAATRSEAAPMKVRAARRRHMPLILKVLLHDHPR
jgi:hypothetical protein